MKRRYYLKGLVRGVGIGIVLTALIMGMTAKAQQPSDAEIRARARALGMVDPNSLSLSDVGTSSGGHLAGQGSDGTGQPAGDENSSPSQTPDETQQSGDGEGISSPGQTNDDVQSGDNEEISSPSSSPDDIRQPDGEEATPSPSPSPVETQSPEPERETITIVIVRGDNSYTVSRRLEEAGLIENAREYDSYLVDNGYSKTIRTGTHRIPLDATWEEIADIIA